MTRRLSLRHSEAERDRGASLIEVVIACVLLGILSSAVLAIVLQTQSAGVGNRNRVAASNLAAREIDMVRSEFYRSESAPLALATAGTTTNRRPLTDGTAGQPLVVDGTPYTVTTSTQWNVTGTAQSACDGGSLVTYPTLAVTVRVTWPNMGSIKPVVSAASLAPEKGDGITTTDVSFVAVRITDATGAPNQGRGVAVTGGGATVSGTTDTQGCAVVQVNPASAGTAYTARVSDAGYVDISGTANPSKSVGTLTRGKLNNSVLFQVDRPGAVNIRLVGDDGALVDASTAAGAQITLVASESSGSTSSRVVTATGPITTVPGLWPTTYGAYVGANVPANGFFTKPVTSGATVELDAVLASGRVRLEGMPDGTTGVVAVPGGAACTDPAARAVDPASVSLLPGSWSFYASGALFTCSPGPDQVTLQAGDNGVLPWEQTTLQVVNAPEGVLWAVNRTRLGESLATCPGPSAAPIAVNVDGARAAPVVLPAGDWYVYVTDGPAVGTCRGVPAAQYSKVLPYGSQSVISWATLTSQVAATALPRGQRYGVVAWTGAETMSCSTGLPGAATTFGKQSTNATRATAQLDAGTWRLFVRDTTARTCTFAGTVVVDGTGRAYEIALNTSSPGTVR
ncbi:type IV pilus modification PilV family protein [Cellulomonas triticagri]|uniref:type IV pilus modification PilV family protein n=1 Tax=Cellulomonas triticagri TaxID=2483352 RepID=UPI0018F539C1|nr:hypothetical protein [Cellulomonas triticagri]